MQHQSILRSVQTLTRQQHTTTTVLRPLSGTTQVSLYLKKKHSPTHHPDQPIFISLFHLPRSIASSLYAWQSFCTTSLHVLLVYLLAWSPPPHIPYVSSPNQCLLFATHAHTITTCFAAVSILYHLFSIDTTAKHVSMV